MPGEEAFGPDTGAVPAAPKSSAAAGGRSQRRGADCTGCTPSDDRDLRRSARRCCSGQLLLGLVNGSFYAMLSLGLAVIFGLLNIINFAHGACT